MSTQPPVPAQENLHLALAMLLRRANPRVSPSWSNKALLAEVEHHLGPLAAPRPARVEQASDDDLFSLFDEPVPA